MFGFILGVIIGVWVKGKDMSAKADRSKSEKAVTSKADKTAIISKFLRNYRAKVKNKSAQKLIDDMLASASDPTNEQTATQLKVSQATKSEVEAEPAKAKQPIDNTALLLYFGAFLFVASMGLFVAFSEVTGEVKTTLVGIVAFTLYFGGLELGDRRQQFKQVGLAFVAIGMAVVPLIGLAMYRYVFEDSNAEIVWFVTSIVAMAMYVHALSKLHNTIVSYLLIFTFLSLFESAVSIVDLPLHYYAWALAITGMLLQLITKRVSGQWQELKEPAFNSSQVLVALTIVVSVYMLGSNGVGQLAVSLGLSSLFFAIQSMNRDQHQPENVMVAHILLIMTVLSGAYHFNESAETLVIALAGISGLHVLFFLVNHARNHLVDNAVIVAMVTSVPGIFIAFQDAELIVASLVVGILLNAILALFYKRKEAFGLAVFGWSFLPIVVGQGALSDSLSLEHQAIFSLVSLLPLTGVMIAMYQKKASKDWIYTGSSLYMLSSALVVLIGAYSGAWQASAIISGVVVNMLLIEYFSKDRVWISAAGTASAMIVIRGFAEPSNEQFLIGTLLVLALNISLSLIYKNDTNRWISSGVWLILPIAAGNGALGNVFSPAGIAWGYVFVMLALILSRAIARGMLMLSSKTVVSSLSKHASQAYLAGAVTAGVFAFTASLNSSDTQLHVTLVTGVVGVSLALFGRFIERSDEIGALLPITFQVMAFSLLEPWKIAGDQLHGFIFLSSALAVVGYLSPMLLKQKPLSGFIKHVSLSSLVMAFVVPALVVVDIEVVWSMPIALMVAGGLSLHAALKSNQANREIAGAVLVLGFMWWLHVLGVRNIQAYSHIVAATAGFYAYWRWTREEKAEADNYVWLMLISATVPLLLQAFDGASGDVYGTWLIVEMIGFILLGSTIRYRLVTMWGLYVAVGAVLYQLRDLGWAMLAVLAVFVIGVAIYQTDKQSKSK